MVPVIFAEMRLRLSGDAKIPKRATTIRKPTWSPLTPSTQMLATSEMNVAIVMELKQGQAFPTANAIVMEMC